MRLGGGRRRCLRISDLRLAETGRHAPERRLGQCHNRTAFLRSPQQVRRLPGAAGRENPGTLHKSAVRPSLRDSTPSARSANLPLKTPAGTPQKSPKSMALSSWAPAVVHAALADRAGGTRSRPVVTGTLSYGSVCPEFPRFQTETCEAIRFLPWIRASARRWSLKGANSIMAPGCCLQSNRMTGLFGWSCATCLGEFRTHPLRKHSPGSAAFSAGLADL